MSKQTLVDLITERRVLAAIITEPDVRAAANELDETAFSDPRAQHVLRAVRTLQACESDIGLDELDHELKLADMARHEFGGAVPNQARGWADHGWTMGAGQVADKAGFWFIAELLIGTAPYRGATLLVDHDLWWLRELAERRRQIGDLA